MDLLPARIVLALSVIGAALPLPAQDSITIYRCTDATGALTVQNGTACPPGHEQQVQVIDVPPALPSYVSREERMPEVVAAEQAAVAATILKALPATVPVGERTGPPALFQCATWDNTEYLTEDETPAERCAPMRVVGLDGRPQPRLGSACQKTVDRCEAVAEEALCAAWRRRVDEAAFRWKFARAPAGDPRHIEYERLAATLANSTCAK